MLYDPKWEKQFDTKESQKRGWVSALRSGLYQQTNGYFEHRGAYCALGVLCKALSVPTMDGIISNWTGLFDVAPWIEGHHQAIYGMNDDGKSFAEIADWIDANL